MNNDKIFTFLTTSALAVCIVNFGVKSQEKLADMHGSEIVLSLGAYSNNYSYNCCYTKSRHEQVKKYI